MLKYLISFIFILIGFHVAAQNDTVSRGRLTSLSCTVVDKIDKRPLPNATVGIHLARDSSMVVKMITDENGRFVAERLPFGHYYVVVTYVGYNAYKGVFYTLDEQNLKASMRYIFLERSKGVILNETTILGKKALINLKNDRLIFNVEQSLGVSGGDAIDALKKTPGVKVSDNSIELTGKNSVKILINNRLVHLSGGDLISYLKTLQADQLSKIEVISNPPSNYDADGGSGIINIVTKKNKDIGFSGLMTSSLTKAKYYSGNIGGDINYSIEKLNIHFGARTAKSKYSGVSNEKTFYPDQLWNNSIDYPYGSKTLAFNTDVDYKLNKNNSIGLSINNSLSKSYQNPNSSTKIFDAANDTLDSLINTEDIRNSNPKSNALNIRFESKLDTSGKKLNIDIDFFSYDKIQKQQYFSHTNSFSDIVLNEGSLKSQTPQQIKIYSAKTEFVIPGKSFNYSIGAKASFIKNNSSADYYTILNSKEIYDIGKSNAFEYSENTQALFITANRDLKNWAFQFGIRTEATQTSGLSTTYKQYNTNNYLRLFPTAFVSNKIDENNTLALSYTKRIDRPGYARLNPFRSYSNPYSYAEGNPFLQPAYNDNIELNHQYKSWLISKAYLNVQKNGFEQISLPDPILKTTTIIQSNYLKTYNYGLNEMASFNLGSWLEIISELDLYYKKSISSDPRTKKVIKGMGALISTDNTATLNKSKTLFLNISFWYQFPEVNNLTNFESYYSLDMSLRAKLFKKVSVNIVAQDVLKTMGQNYSFYTSDILQKITNYSDNRRLRLSVSYKFGGKAFKKIVSGSNKEETQRL